MTADVSAIGGVLERVATIESRLSPSPADQRVVTIESSVEFDPFGAEYQRAVEAAAAAPRPVSTSTPWPVATGAAVPWGATAVRSVGGYGSMAVPPELGAFGNGVIPADQLTPIAQHGHRLYGPAAASWDALVDAAADDGIDLRITDSYRSYDEQVDLVRRKGLYSEGGLGATPGTSNHGWGLAVDADVTEPATLDWLRANGPRFGWVEAVPREPWHWEYRPHEA